MYNGRLLRSQEVGIEVLAEIEDCYPEHPTILCMLTEIEGYDLIELFYLKENCEILLDFVNGCPLLDTEYVDWWRQFLSCWLFALRKEAIPNCNFVHPVR